MPNTISFSQLVSDLSLAEFQFNSPCIFTADRSFETDFMDQTYQSGLTVQIRKQNFGTTTRGRIAVPEDINEETVPLTIGPEYLNSWQFDSKELTLEVTKNAPRYQQRYVSPRILNLVSTLERDIMQSGVLDVNYVVGSPTSLISDFSMVDIAYAQMTELGMPTAAANSFLLSPRDATALKATNQNAFNQTLNTDISFESQLGRYSAFNLYQTPATVIHQAGSGAGTPVVSVVPASGATSISVSGLTALAVGVYRAGDIISFGTFGTATAVESVNKVSRQSTGQLMTFVVQADVNADAGGNAIIPISPAIISDPANNRRNVSQNIPLNAPVNLLGAGLRYRISYAYTSRGLSLVMPPMARIHAPEVGIAMDKDSGISLRISIAFDPINGLDLFRVEFLAGYKFHQDYAVRIVSAIS